MKYALIKSGFVVNIIECDAEFATQISPDFDAVVGNDSVGIGWAWNGSAFTAPVQPPSPGVRVITKLAYMNRFTAAELAAIYTTARTVVQIEIWLEKFKLAQEINLDDPDTVAGLQAMEAGGLIGAGRALAIAA